MESKMAKVIEVVLIVLLVALWCVGWGFASYTLHKEDKQETVSEYYALATKVVAIDQEADIVTCEDCNGNLWEFYGVEDWEVGDCASLLMESHGTKKIEDDTIEDVRFSAWELTR